MEFKGKAIISSVFLLFALSACNSSNKSTVVEPAVPDNPRNALANPGEAEVIADTGYKHTVFDSAKEKCQHCHNDLYDTWTKSGHSVAWKGPIFQSQFQNVVRARLTQLSLSPDDEETKTSNQKKFKGRVKFCVKCHAPAAWYSNDIKIDLEEIPLATNETLTKAKLAELKAANETNLAGPNFDSTQATTVVGFDNQGKVFKSTLHIGHAHNREGVNCAYCHSIETVRMLSESGDDGGEYKLAKTLPNSGFSAGDVLHYNKDGENREMNSFFRFAASEIYSDYGNTPKVLADFDTNKKADGRHTMKSIVKGQHTGGPYYGPFGVTGLANHSASDTVDRGSLVKASFSANPEGQHFEEQSKGLCLSCHQCAMGRKDNDPNNPNHFNTGCAIWQANSNFGIAANNNDVVESPKCARCHMERVANKTVLHKWNSPDELFTAADGVSSHFDPDGTKGPVPEKYLNNHAFMATKIKNYGAVKLKSAVDSSLTASKSSDGNRIIVNASLLNKTGHFFPGTMPMRRALMRVVATDSTGKKLSLVQATGNSAFEDVTHQIATLPNETIPAGRGVITRIKPTSPIQFTGHTPDLDGSVVNSQKFGSDVVTFTSPHPGGFPPPLNGGGGATPILTDSGLWRYQGKIKVRKIVDNTAATDNFTRIYGYQMLSNATGTDVVRPGMDSTGVEATSLSPNERETYTVEFDSTGVTGAVTVTYKAYYMTKGANTQFPTAADGFLNADAAKEKKLLISELFEKTATVE